jgi:hypothetical protein
MPVLTCWKRPSIWTKPFGANVGAVFKLLY